MDNEYEGKYLEVGIVSYNPTLMKRIEDGTSSIKRVGVPGNYRYYDTNFPLEHSGCKQERNNKSIKSEVNVVSRGMRDENMMWLKLNTYACEIHFRIRDYKSKKRPHCDDWCTVDLTIRAGRVISYALYDDESLENDEVSYIESTIDATLQGEGVNGQVIAPLEPYMEFVFYPRREYAGGEFKPVMRWRVTLWDDSSTVATEDYISMYIEEEALNYLSLYLKYARHNLTADDERIADMIARGIMYS